MATAAPNRSPAAASRASRVGCGSQPPARTKATAEPEDAPAASRLGAPTTARSPLMAADQPKLSPAPTPGATSLVGVPQVAPVRSNTEAEPLSAPGASSLTA